MSYTDSLVVEPLHKHHNRAKFHGASQALDHYLQRQANQDLKRHISRAFVAVEPTSPDTILGYYTLSAVSIDLSYLPMELVRKLPKNPLPGALNGRLAVDMKAQGKGIGRMLLADAIKRTLAIRTDIGIYAMVVDAIDDAAEVFYKRFGFSPLQGKRLFLPLTQLKQDF